MREALQRTVRRIVVGVDRGLTIEAKPGGLLGLNGNPGQLKSPGEHALMRQIHYPREAGNGG